MTSRGDGPGPLELAVARNGWRLDALDNWRRQEVEPALRQLRRDVGELVNQDAIEAAVTTAVRNERRTLLNVPQKILLGLFALIALVGNIVAIVQAVHG